MRISILIIVFWRSSWHHGDYHDYTDHQPSSVDQHFIPLPSATKPSLWGTALLWSTGTASGGAASQWANSHGWWKELVTKWRPVPAHWMWLKVAIWFVWTSMGGNQQEMIVGLVPMLDDDPSAAKHFLATAATVTFFVAGVMPSISSQPISTLTPNSGPAVGNLPGKGAEKYGRGSRHVMSRHPWGKQNWALVKISICCRFRSSVWNANGLEHTTSFTARYLSIWLEKLARKSTCSRERPVAPMQNRNHLDM